jgi:hypothetical protein
MLKMNLVYSGRPAPAPPAIQPSSNSQTNVQPRRPTSIANASMFIRVVKPEGGCGCGGGH